MSQADAPQSDEHRLRPSLIAHRSSLSLPWLIKEPSDRIGAFALLLLLSPLLVLVAVCVRATSPGPIIFRRRVLGLDGREIDAYKFRTMVVDADRILAADPELGRRYDAQFKLQQDPRLTPLGGWLRRLSVDELPQLVNVLRGQMSLVGPRMVAPDEIAKYGAFAMTRLQVKPGLTGLWQVSGRQETTYEDRISLDRRYIAGWSLGLDAWILLRTIPAVLSMRGAY
jgi:lipopolysaccharide/colanic/teichoic acid biosynthesis glycosyltransferase